MSHPHAFAQDLRLQTPRLQLRPMGSDDAAAWFAIMADPQVMRFWNHAPWHGLAEAQAALVIDRQAYADGQVFKLGIYRRDNDKLIGMCQCFHLEAESRRGEIGYCLASDAQGQGFMAEALEHFVRYLGEGLKLRRLEAEIDPRNSASARTLERLGFILEGTLRQRWCVGGEVSDSGLYGLLLEQNA
ncbi:GNAT family N-acetyltransferase [Pseudomonas sp. GD03860]|uniref:GNAT family N-acetyltransferase n=1 Tax=Pseudomonas TaxID=286 RepID=UPI002363A7B9|nr:MULTISPECIES: GNAT family N-acetyltransferase [Pseudomonas]MDD2060608.1 GNAT family N-acetyltransferase [Pseudomonas putida]MDH0637816.1 GNAT family N-acetyltransferase [Pseudomonas sp. GD03860]